MLEEVIKSHIDAAMAQLYTSMPAKITAVKKKGKGTVVDVQPLLNRQYRDGNVDQEPVLSNVPLQWPSGGGCFITMPLEVGDQVLLHFSMRGLGAYKNGDGTNPITSTDKRLHTLSGAFATPCIHTYQNGLEVDSSGVKIASDAVEIMIKKDGTIEFGEGATEQLVLGTTFLNLYNSLSVPTGVGPSGPPISPMVDATHLSQITKTK